MLSFLKLTLKMTRILTDNHLQVLAKKLFSNFLDSWQLTILIMLNKSQNIINFWMSIELEVI